MKLRNAILLLLLAMPLVGCESDIIARRIAREQAETQRRIESISLTNGISAEDAHVLAEAYWNRFSPTSCGMVETVRDGGNYWFAPNVAGYVPVKRPEIVIEKATGYISWDCGPTVTNWAQLWR